MLAEKHEAAAEKETGRLEAFSDGVFAVAITLLVFDLLKLPAAPADHVFTAAELAGALGSQWPSYAIFLISFVTIFIMWVNHHAMFKQVGRTSTPFMFANGALLLLVTIVPLPTALVGAYLLAPAAATAVGVYAGLFVAIALAYMALWRAAVQGGLLRPEVTPAQIAQRSRLNLIGLPAYLLALACSFWWPLVSVAICGVLWLVWLVGSYLTHEA